MEAIVTLQFNGTDVTVGKYSPVSGAASNRHISHTIRPICALSNAVSLCPEMPSPRERSRPSIMRCIASFQDCMPDRWGRNSCSCRTSRCSFGHRQHAHYLEGDLLLSVNDETRQGALRFWNNDGDALAPQ